jgi:hypothetical protein
MPLSTEGKPVCWSCKEDQHRFCEGLMDDPEQYGVRVTCQCWCEEKSED